MATPSATGAGKSLSGNEAALPVRQGDRAQATVAYLLATTRSDQLTLPRELVEALLRPSAAVIAADDGIARDAEEAGSLVGLSPSRVKRLAGAGYAPGAYREAGRRGRWMFPLPALRALQAAMRSGVHRGVGRRASAGGEP